MKFFESPTTVGKLAESVIRMEMTKEQIRRLPTAEDVQRLTRELRGEEISYDRFFEILRTSDEGSGRLMERFGKASVFLSASEDGLTADGETLVDVVVDAVQTECLALSMAVFAEDGRSLSGEELRDWLFYLSRRQLSQVKEVAEKLLPWWVEMAAETFVFFAENRKFHIIDQLARTGISDLLLELKDQSDKYTVFDLYTSRLCRYRGIHYGELYVNLVVPESVHLMVAGNLLNKKMVERVFVHSGRAYPLLSQWLRFCISLENRSTPAAAGYLFDLLDVEGKGEINYRSLVPFIQGLYKMLEAEKVPLPGPLPSAVSLAHELMDLVGRMGGALRREAAIREAESFGTLVGAITGHEYFLQYETRDEKAQDRAGERMWKLQVRRQARLVQRETKTRWCMEMCRDLLEVISDWRGTYRRFIDHHTLTYNNQNAEPEISQYYELEQAFQDSLREGHLAAAAGGHSAAYRE